MATLSKTLATGAVLVALLGSVPTSAEQGRNAAAAAGAIGGFALGAAVGSAARPAPRTYYSGPHAFSVYEDDAPAECRIVTRRTCDGYGCRTRRTEICD